MKLCLVRVQLTFENSQIRVILSENMRLLSEKEIFKVILGHFDAQTA